MSKVRAVKSREDIDRITLALEKNYGQQYAQIWRMAVNIGLRMGDVLSISMEQAKAGLLKGTIEIREQKTNKGNNFALNAGAQEIIKQRIHDHPGDVWLFQSHSNRARSLNKPLSRTAVYNAIVAVGEIVGIKLGTHSARKTRGRMLYENGVAIEKIAAVLNHSSVRQTMVYLDITQDEIHQTYDQFVI